MKKFLWGVIIGAVILGGCKKEKKERAEFNKEIAQGILPVTVEATSQMFLRFYNPAPPLYYRLQNFYQDCVTVEGDTTDNDHDGYVKNATFIYDCDISNPPYTFKIKGKFKVEDYNDNDSCSGFRTQIEDFNYETSGGPQPVSFAMDALFEIISVSPETKGKIQYSFSSQGTLIGWGFDFTYAADNQNNPWKGGKFNFEGSFTTVYQNVEYDLNIKGEDLHFVEDSGCVYPESGKVTITDGKNYLVVEFSCNNYTATFNGFPVAK